jgi:predicted  nucleic acid-binding Zn-ribbon protein
MSRVAALYALQQADNEIDRRLTSISQIEVALADDTALKAVQEAAREAETSFNAVRTRLRDLEIAAEDSELHAADLEKRLYDGKIKGVKEMGTAQHEITTFRQRRKELDDQAVEAMIELEEVDNKNKAAKAKLAEATAEWEKSTAALREERARLEGELPGLRATREQRVKAVMPPDLPVYEKLRSQKQGIAVAEVQNGKLCGRCRVELPLTKQREVKSGMNIVNCPSCGRILYFR